MNIQEYRIEAQFEYSLPHNGNYAPGKGFAEDLIITTDGQRILLTGKNKKSAVTIEDVAQKLLSSIAQVNKLG